MRHVKTSIKKIIVRADSGGVLFEYVLLLVLILVPLICVSKFVSSPSGTGMFYSLGASGVEDYGMLGNEFINWVRRIISGVSLPVP